MTKRWYVVRTKQAKEAAAAISIAAEGFQTFLPVTLVERSHAGKRERISRPLFPRYIFVRFDPEASAYGKLNYCRGAAPHHALMCDANDNPIPVPDRVIDGIRDRERAMKAKVGEVQTGYQPGDTFRVQVGPWAQLEARYVGEVKGEVWVSISLFGADHMLALPFEAVPLCENSFDRLSA